MFYKAFIPVLLVGLLAFANEDAKKEEAPAKEGEKKEEAKTEKKEDGWQEVSARVQALKAKVETHEKNIQALVQEKATSHSEARLSEIVKQLVLEHKSYMEASKEYDRERAFLMYRFPEKGVKGDRKYERLEVKSLEEMESQMSLEGRVRGVLTKVRKQYPVKEESVKEGETGATKTKKRKGTHEDADAEEDQLSSPIIYSK